MPQHANNAPPTEPQLHQALHELQKGHVVAIPTETVYGLAADITLPAAVELIFKIKERPFFDPLIVHLADAEQAIQVVAKFPPLAQKLAEKFWPGPLTMVLPKRKDVNPMITSGLETVGVRVPNHPLTRELIQRLGHPVAAPSANKFGRTSPTRAEHVKSEFGEQVFVLDGGPCSLGIESTVIGFDESLTEIKILRPGSITREMLAAEAKIVEAVDHPSARGPSGQKATASPGQLEFHYQPSLPLIILSSNSALTPDLYLQLQTELGVTHLYPSWMSLPEDPTQAARLLYENMRVAARRPGANCILLPFELQDSSLKIGLWMAIHDRLRKASSKIV